MESHRRVNGSACEVAPPVPALLVLVLLRQISVVVHGWCVRQFDIRPVPTLRRRFEGHKGPEACFEANALVQRLLTRLSQPYSPRGPVPLAA